MCNFDHKALLFLILHVVNRNGFFVRKSDTVSFTIFCLKGWLIHQCLAVVLGVRLELNFWTQFHTGVCLYDILRFTEIV